MAEDEGARSEGTSGATGDNGRPRVVIGVDGSEAAKAALARALEEARLRGAVLEVVIAWQYPFEMAAGSFAVPAPAGEMALWAEEVLDDALEGIAPGDGTAVVRRAQYGAPVQVLMEAAKGAELLVVGTRGHSRVTGLFLGSVSQYLVVHAPCPVMVVHAPPATAEAAAAGSAGTGAAGVPATDEQPGGPMAGGDEEEAVEALEEIPEAECLALLAGHSVGRLVVVREDGPQAFPVNYVLDGHTVAIRTNPGTTLDWATMGRIAFEVDDIDEAHQQGWSVLVQGVGRDVTDGVDAWSERLRAHELHPWAGGERSHWIAIASPRITGRRVHHRVGPEPLARL